MDTKVSYTLVGAFVVILTAGIVFTIVWLTSGLSMTQNKYYLVYSEESVSGLNIDAPVEYNGIVVGAVKDISFAPSNPHLVKLLVQVKSDTPVSRGTAAVLSSRGITGIAFLALKDTGTDNRPLVAKPGEEYPVIPTSPSLFLRLDIIVRRLARNFDTMTNSLHALLDKKNLAAFQHILAHLDEVTGTLATHSIHIKQLLENSSRASRELSPLLLHSTHAVNMFNTQTLPATNQLLTTLNTVSQTLNEIAVDMKANPSILLRGSSPKLPGPGE